MVADFDSDLVRLRTHEVRRSPIDAVTQLRRDTKGRAYYRRRRAAGKRPKEAFASQADRQAGVVLRQTRRAGRARGHPAQLGELELLVERVIGRVQHRG